MTNPETIQRFCEGAKETGALAAAFLEIQQETFLEWLTAEDAMARDRIYHTMQALEKVQLKFEEMAVNGPRTEQS